MLYTFQSRQRNVDVGTQVRFRNFMFATSDDTKAEIARRNCAANPSEFWEVTGGAAPPAPAPTTTRGMRTVGNLEHAREQAEAKPKGRPRGKPFPRKQEMTAPVGAEPNSEQNDNGATS